MIMFALLFFLYYVAKGSSLSWRSETVRAFVRGSVGSVFSENGAISRGCVKLFKTDLTVMCILHQEHWGILCLPVVLITPKTLVTVANHLKCFFFKKIFQHLSRELQRNPST